MDKITFIIGAQKCGTSSIHKILSSLYKTDVAPKEARCDDFSITQYSYFVYATLMYDKKAVNKTIQTALDNSKSVRIIVIVRDPVQRALSALRNHRMAGRKVNLSDCENQELINEAIRFSCYNQCIPELQTIFEKNSLVEFSVFRFEKIFKSRDSDTISALFNSDMTELYRIDQQLDIVENKSRRPRYYIIDKVIHHLSDFIQRKISYNLYCRLRGLGLHLIMRTINTSKQTLFNSTEEKALESHLKEQLHSATKYYEKVE